MVRDGKPGLRGHRVHPNVWKKVKSLRRGRLWRVFWFGVALGLLLAVIHHARAEIQVIRALLFD